MSIPLEELRAQRRLVQEHLTWIDRQIAAAQGPVSPTSTAPVAGAPDAVPPSGIAAPPVAQHPPAAEATSSPVPTAPLSPDAAPPPGLPMPVPVGGISPVAKYGCIALVILVLAGFLFALFVLPSFLYK